MDILVYLHDDLTSADEKRLLDFGNIEDVSELIIVLHTNYAVNEKQADNIINECIGGKGTVTAITEGPHKRWGWRPDFARLAKHSQMV